jgi:hypothetical protein
VVIFIGSVRAVEGIRAHQQIQNQRSPEYRSEVSVTHVVEHTDFELCVTGRIDGILVNDSVLLQGEAVV